MLGSPTARFEAPQTNTLFPCTKTNCLITSTKVNVFPVYKYDPTVAHQLRLILPSYLRLVRQGERDELLLTPGGPCIHPTSPAFNTNLTASFWLSLRLWSNQVISSSSPSFPFSFGRDDDGAVEADVEA